MTGERKVVSLAEAAALVADGDHITIGRVMLHRIPAAAPPSRSRWSGA